MARKLHRLTAEQTRQGQFTHTYNALKRQLQRQEVLGNLTPYGQSLLQDDRSLGIKQRENKLRIAAEEIMAQRRIAKQEQGASYVPDPNLVKDTALQYTKTGYLAKYIGGDILNPKVRYGRETTKLYKEVVKQAALAGDPRTYSYDVQIYEGKKLVDKNFRFNLFDIQTFISSASPQSLIALRIGLLGEERDEVLQDYGY